MKLLIVIFMFLITIFSVQSIVEKAREVKVGNETISRSLTNAGCIALAFIAVAYDVACLFLLVKVV